MVTTWLMFLVPIVSCHEVYESAEETYNITTLYPVTNNTIKKIIHDKNVKNHTETYRDNNKTNDVKDENDKQNNYKNEKAEIIITKNKNVPKWKINATYVQPEDVESHDSNSTESKEILTVIKPASKTVEKEFKPSPHLGSFFDDDNLNHLRFSKPETYLPIEKKPPIDFTSSRDLYMLNYKSPDDTYRDQIDTPYRYENSYFPKTNNWKLTLDSKPTIEAPTKIPAGGLYNHPDPFKEKPSSNGDDEDFGLAFNEDGKQKENPVKKRSNPWRHLLSLVTAFLPVGLIISALTPSVITIHSTENDPHVNRFSRRSDGGFADVPQISERCKRRLLCEIHSEENYMRPRDKAAYIRKHCYKIHCENPEALYKVLRWLLAHRPNRYHPGYPAQPEPELGHHVQYKEDQFNSDLRRHHRSSDFT